MPYSTDVIRFKDEAIVRLNRDLAELAQKYPNVTDNDHDAAALIAGTAAVIGRQLQEAFAKVTTKPQRVILYKALALVLRDDHITSNDTVFVPAVKNYLIREKLEYFPGDILRLYNPNLIDKQHPIDAWWDRTLSYGMNASNFKELIKNIPTTTDDSYKIALRKNLARQEIADKNFSSGYHYLSEANLKRYPVPFNFFARLIYRFLTVAKTIAQILLFILQIPSIIADCIIDWLLNLHTAWLFHSNKILDRTKIGPEEASYLQALKIADGKESLSDQDYITGLSQEHNRIPQFINQDPQNTNSFKFKFIAVPAADIYDSKIGIIDTIKFILSAMHQVLTRPLPTGAWNKFWAILAWSARFITAIPLLVLALVVSAVSKTIDYSLLIAAVGLIIAASAIQLALNTPLLLWDTAAYIASAVKNVFSSKPKAGTEQNVAAVQGATYTDLMKPNSDLNAATTTGVEAGSTTPVSGASDTQSNGNSGRTPPPNVEDEEGREEDEETRPRGWGGFCVSR